jgi:superfamily II DNA helicase RecQ
MNVDAESSNDMKDHVISGACNIIFMRPELLRSKWRNLLSTSTYQKRLVGIIVDEAHCVVKW